MSEWTDKDELKLYDIVTSTIERRNFVHPNLISIKQFSPGFLDQFIQFGASVKRITKEES